MPYPSRVETWNSDRAQSRIAFAYSTKDRVELSVRTLAPLKSTHGFDLYWMDGSRTDAGQALPSQMCADLPALREVHYGVTGGPDVAIVYALTCLLQKGYEYVGLLENDVLLEPGWLERLIKLFQQGKQDGLRVGAASARTILERTLVSHGDYGVMFNLGAGMMMLTREAALAILRRYRTSSPDEIRGIVHARTGLDISKRAMAVTGPSADWFFDVGLMLDGFSSLAPIPSMASNIDADLAQWGCSLVTDSNTVPERPGAFDLLRQMQGINFEPAPSQMAYHPGLGRIVFPHQILTALPGFVGKGWKIVWRQGFGPFALESKGSEASMTLPAWGAPMAFIFEGHPQGGEVVLSVGNDRTSISLLREKPETILIHFPGPAADGATLQLTAQSAGVVWCGVQLGDPYFSFPSVDTFDFHVLQPFL